MKTTKRLTKAITKLYNAFHNGELDAMDCQHCAVGNLCNNTDDWAKSLCLIGERIPSLESISMTGYSPKEINNIECQFIYGLNSYQYQIELPLFRNAISNKKVKKGFYTKEEQKALQFKGLEAVIKYLCELDGIDNVMDYTKVFNYNEKGAVNELKEVLWT